MIFQLMISKPSRTARSTRSCAETEALPAAQPITRSGPGHSAAAAEHVEDRAEEAAARGGRRRAGSDRAAGAGGSATEHLARGENGRLLGLMGGKVVATPLEEVVGTPKPLDLSLLALHKVLAQ